MPHQVPLKHPGYATYQSRFESFVGWPKSDVIKGEKLATAGFVYIGHDDCVKCFSCGGGMRQWEHGDDPWVLHAESFPWCPFVTAEKGPEFMEEHRKVYFDQDGPAEAEEENLEFDDLIACKVCRGRKANTLLMPCSHLACCETCAPQVMHCSVCQAPVMERIRVHMS